MKKITLFFRNLMANTLFLKIISVVIAIGVWIYIVNYADPSREAEYSNIPVSFVYEGTVPYNNYLIPLITNKNFYVNIRVSGPRSNIFAFSKDKIHASLNFNSVAAEGTYDIPISISLDDDKLNYDIISGNTIKLEFAKKSTVTLAVDFKKTGSYRNGFSVINKMVSPSTVTIEGPKSIIDTIKTAEVQLDVSDHTNSVIGIADINLLTEDRNYVDRTYLTLSASQASVSVGLQYSKNVKATVSLLEPYGGDESSYVTVSYSPSQTIRLTGEESTLSMIDNYNIGSIDLTEITEGSKTFDFTIKDQDSIKVAEDSVNTVSVTVDLNGAKTKKYYISKDFLSKCRFLNVPENMHPSITNRSKTITIRSLPYILDEITVEDLTLAVDLSSIPNEKGEYPLMIDLPSGLSGAFMNQYYVSVDLGNS